MNNLRVSETKDILEKNGEPFFYFADTVWSAFYNVPIEDWKEYLDYRKMQGFNVLQIIILPIKHDASESNLSIDPFSVKEDGNYNYFEIIMIISSERVKCWTSQLKKALYRLLPHYGLLMSSQRTILTV